MFQFLKLFILGIALINSMNIYATDEQVNHIPVPAENKEVKKYSEYQQIIDKYKHYLSTVNPKVREEVKTYRLENSKIQQQKRELYKKLSNEAQEFLKVTQELKRQLPIQQRRNLNQEINDLKAQQVN